MAKKKSKLAPTAGKTQNSFSTGEDTLEETTLDTISIEDN
jgi:hypothetical protein